MGQEKKKSWYLYQSQTENRINALDYEAVSEILFKVPVGELPFWFAWHKKMKEWQQVQAIEELKEIFEKKEEKSFSLPSIPIPPPPPFKKEVPASTKQDSQGREQRKHPRFEMELKIIFKKENALFRTFTTNVSLGGVALKNPLPDEFLIGESEIILSSPQWNENIKFKGCLAENLTNKNRIQFIETREFFKQKLEQWLKELQETKGSKKLA